MIRKLINFNKNELKRKLINSNKDELKRKLKNDKVLKKINNKFLIDWKSVDNYSKKSS